MAERLFTIPLTGEDGVQHEVTDENFNASTSGVYDAVCGTAVRVVSVLAPPGNPHSRCLDIVAAARRAAAAPDTETVPEQSRGRRRGVLALLHGGRR